MGAAEGLEQRCGGAARLQGPPAAPTHLEKFIKHFWRLCPGWSTWDGCAEHHCGYVAWIKSWQTNTAAITTANTVEQQPSQVKSGTAMLWHKQKGNQGCVYRECWESNPTLLLWHDSRGTL